MKKYIFIALLFALGTYLYGCGKKQETLEDVQQPMSMETLTTMNTTTPAIVQTTEAKAPEAKVETVAVSSAKPGKLEQLPPAGPFKPTAVEIQTALKNANFYTGEVDGKLGPKTKKAISEFQKANGLTADGKVGPKTWSALSKHLNLEPTTSKAR